jgi:pSer/pThr/pTyr-binding forkhead associated (FHA) protein
MRSVPPPNRGGATAPAAPMASRAYPPTAAVAAVPSGSLAIYYKGEFFKINKDRFVIGRGKQSSDLTIKDPNVSRQHAMIEYLNGQYYIVDMGSTNGIEFEGQRIQRKAINDGDIFRVCDHELLFVFQ